MSALLDWLAERRPEAPEALARRVVESVSEGSAGSADVGADVLLSAARVQLRETLVRPGRVREAAFHLLVADALVTYACEAALETEHPAEVLRRLVEAGRRA